MFISFHCIESSIVWLASVCQQPRTPKHRSFCRRKQQQRRVEFPQNVPCRRSPCHHLASQRTSGTGHQLTRSTLPLYMPDVLAEVRHLFCHRKAQPSGLNFYPAPNQHGNPERALLYKEYHLSWKPKKGKDIQTSGHISFHICLREGSPLINGPQP